MQHCNYGGNTSPFWNIDGWLTITKCFFLGTSFHVQLITKTNQWRRQPWYCRIMGCCFFFFFLRGKGVTIVGLFCFSTVIGNLFFSIYYTCSYSFFFFKTDLTYIKRPKTSRIKPGFLWFSFWPWASPLSPSAVTKLLPTSCARCWGQPEAGCMPPLRSTLLASVLQNHPQTATTCTEVGWTFRDKTLALAVWSTVDSGLPVIPVYR